MAKYADTEKLREAIERMIAKESLYAYLIKQSTLGDGVFIYKTKGDKGFFISLKTANEFSDKKIKDWLKRELSD